MAISRYTRTPVLAFSSQYATSVATQMIRKAIQSGVIPVKEYILHDGERLDTLAGEFYGDGRYWWVLAAASDIGWGLQIPPGTVIKVPLLTDVLKIVA
jgi:nucleoid-associated protein YgaU